MSERVAIITAGGSGMGAAAGRRLANDGFRIAILWCSGKSEALAQELERLGVTDSNQSPEDLKRLVDGAMARWGRIDVLVNSAGLVCARNSTSARSCRPTPRHAASRPTIPA